MMALHCCRCGHGWIPRKTEIRICPKCKSPYWDRGRSDSKPTLGIEAILQEMVRRIVKVATPEKVILFGSHATGHARAGSDVDLLVVTRKGGTRREIAVELYRALRGTGVGKDIVVVRPEDVEKYRDVVGTIIYPAARQGKVLYEHAA